MIFRPFVQPISRPLENIPNVTQTLLRSALWLRSYLLGYEKLLIFLFSLNSNIAKEFAHFIMFSLAIHFRVVYIV